MLELLVGTQTKMLNAYLSINISVFSFADGWLFMLAVYNVESGHTEGSPYCFLLDYTVTFQGPFSQGKILHVD